MTAKDFNEKSISAWMCKCGGCQFIILSDGSVECHKCNGRAPYTAEKWK